MRKSWVIVLGSLLAIGCVGELTPVEGGGGGGGGGGADAGGGDLAAAQTFYTQNIQPMMTAARPKGACTLCHEGVNAADGPDFLGASPASHFLTLINGSRLITGDPATSVFVIRGDHTGDAFCTGLGTPYQQCLEDEVSIVNQFIRLVPPQ